MRKIKNIERVKSEETVPLKPIPSDEIRILYVSYNSILDPLLFVQGLSYIKRLSSEFKFTLLTFESNYKQEFQKINDELREYNVRWIYVQSFVSKNIFKKFLNYLLNARKLIRILSEEKFDVIHARGYASMITVFLVSILLRCFILRPSFKMPKIVFDLRNPTIDEIIEGTRLGKIVKKPLLLFETWLFNFSSAIIVVSDKFKYYVLQKLKNSKVKDKEIFVVYNNVDLTRFNHFDNLESNNRECFKLVYSGVIDKYHSLIPMIEFFKVLKEKIPNSVFYLLIYNEEGQSLAEEIIRGNYEELVNEIFILKMNPQDIPQFLANCSMGIYLYTGDALRGEISYPIKIGEYLAAGLGVIVNRAIGISDVIENSGCGVVLESVDEDEFRSKVEYIKRVFFDKELHEKLKERCRLTAQEYFSLGKSCRNLLKCYKWVLKN